MSIGAEESKQRNSSFTNTDSNSFIAPSQLPYLQNLWTGAQASMSPNYIGSVQGAAGQMNPFLTQGMEGLRGLMDTSGMVAEQDASLQAGLGQLFREQINPAIEGSAMRAGGFGGGRQGVAQGTAVGQLGDAYTKGRGDIVANANRVALGAASQMPQFAQQYFNQNSSAAGAGMDQWARLAAILGGPTILNQSTGRSETTGKTDQWGFKVGIPMGTKRG